MWLAVAGGQAKHIIEVAGQTKHIAASKAIGVAGQDKANLIAVKAIGVAGGQAKHIAVAKSIGVAGQDKANLIAVKAIGVAGGQANQIAVAKSIGVAGQAKCIAVAKANPPPSKNKLPNNIGWWLGVAGQAINIAAAHPAAAA